MRFLYSRERGAAGLITLLLIGVLVFVFLWLEGGILTAREREGVVKYSDCRETVFLKEDNIEKFYKSFTCDLVKTPGGLVVRGQCVHIEYDDKQGCRVAYLYEKSQDQVCPDKAHPVLHRDGLCYPN